MTGFKPGISGVGSNCTTNWATTTAHHIFTNPNNAHDDCFKGLAFLVENLSGGKKTFFE